MTLTKYNPFDVEDFVGTMNRLFAEPGVRQWAPPVDILEHENEVVLKADLPGVEAGNIDVRLDKGTLTLKGERKFEHQNEGKGYHRIERGYGAFTRTFTIPDTLDGENIRAEHKGGVLTVTIPKRETAKPKTVKVEVNG